MSAPILYSFRRCPYAMRARMALHYAGVQCEVREVVLNNKPQELFAISPKATVPVLHLQDGTVLDESLDIMLWALAQSDAASWLNGDFRDAMLELIAHNDDRFKYHLDRYKYPDRFADSNSAEHFNQACGFLSGLEQRLIHDAFLFGASASLADVAIFPFVRQFAAVDQSAFDALPFEHLQQWLSGWLHDARFQAIMVKRQRWSVGQNKSLLLSKRFKIF